MAAVRIAANNRGFDQGTPLAQALRRTVAGGRQVARQPYRSALSLGGFAALLGWRVPSCVKRICGGRRPPVVDACGKGFAALLGIRWWALVLALASAAGQGAAATAWELISPTDFDWRQVEQRRAVAKDLLERLDMLGSAIPPLSPSQQARVLQEAAELERLDPDADSRRRSRLFMSRRYQHFRLLDLLKETRSNLECVLAAAQIGEEMRCWSLASVNFGEEAKLDLALSMLRSARLIPKDGAMPVKAQDPAVWYGEYGRGILKYILTPYLTQQADAEAACAREPAAEAPKHL